MKVPSVLPSASMTIANQVEKSVAAHPTYTRSSIESLEQKDKPIGRGILQLLEATAQLLLLPAFIYTFFIALFPLALMPVLVALTPGLLIQDFMREILHTVLPCVFPDPRFQL